jgi:tRNA threonylcarbamoyladenosine biosynthesis protein TsaB
MNVLAFDTCFDACSVCVAQSRDEGIAELASALERFETGHAERLIPMIEETMRLAGVTFGNIDRLAVTVGPGTFTGTRIGVAAARGLALPTGIAVVGASSLAVMAQAALRELGSLPQDADLAVAVDARRGQACVQLFGASALEPKSPPQLLVIEEAGRIGSGPLIVVGSAAEAVAAAAASAGRRVTARLPHLLPDAAALARMAFELPASQAPLVPLYLRPPDAKPQDGKSIARAQQ